MSKHVMIDLETWGKGPTAQIISIGAVKFDPFNLNGPWDNFHVAVDPQGWSTLPGLHPPFEIDPGTIMWWMDPARDEARAHWVASLKLDLATTLAGFTEWFGTESLPVWGNGATFDNVILSHAFKACGMERPWKFWDDRCFRTLKNQHHDIPRPTDAQLRDWLVAYPQAASGDAVGVPHTALYDAQSQALHMLEIFDRFPFPRPVPSEVQPILDSLAEPDTEEAEEAEEDGVDAFAQGREAYDVGYPETSNPYAGRAEALETSWNDGWAAAAHDAGN